MINDKISIPLPNGYSLVAEHNNVPNYPYEIFIGISGEDGIWYQDLAIVRNAYSYGDDGEIGWKDDEFEVCVYADKDDEDYTDRFMIGLYHGGI